MNFELTGELEFIGATTPLSSNFYKREFVIKTRRKSKDGTDYENYVKFNLFNHNCDLLNHSKVGDVVKVHFNIGGRKFIQGQEAKYFTDLTAWKIETQNADSNLPF